MKRLITHLQNVRLPDGSKTPIDTLIAFANDGTLWSVHAIEGGCGFEPIPELPQPETDKPKKTKSK